MPGPIEGNLLLVTKPKGIYKPADLPYALSIRINLGRYIDGMPLPTPGGGWLLPPGEQPSALPSVADDQ